MITSFSTSSAVRTPRCAQSRAVRSATRKEKRPRLFLTSICSSISTTSSDSSSTSTQSKIF